MSLELSPLATLGGLGSGPTPDDVKRRRLIADQLEQQGSDASPIRSPWQGAARLAQALSGAVDDWRASRDEAAGRSQASKDFAGLFGGGTASAPSVTAAPAGDDGSASVVSAPRATASDVSAPSDLSGMISDAASKYGLSPDFLTREAQIESNFNPKAHNPSGASGLFQFIPSTAANYGLSNPYDAAASTDAAARLARDNAASLAKALGRAPTDGELYLAHQQGAGGAAGLLSNPNAPAASIVGLKAVVQNGGSPNMTAGQFAKLWTSKFPGAPVQVASNDPNAAMAYAAPEDDKGTQFLQADELPPDTGQARDAAMGTQVAQGPAPTSDAAPSASASAPAPAAAGQKYDPAALLRVIANPWSSDAAKQIAVALWQQQNKESQWSQPYKDQFGNVVQRDNTGKITILNNQKDLRDAENGGTQRAHVVGGALVDNRGHVLYQSPASVPQSRPVDEDGKPIYSPPEQQLGEMIRQGLPLPPGLSRAKGGGDLIKGAVEYAGTVGNPNPAEEAKSRGQNRANWAGANSEQRTLGTATANNTLYGNAAASTMDTALQASAAVPRTKWVPINQLMQMAETATSDPDLARLKAATNTLVNDYAKATTPVGVPTDHQREEAMKILSTVQSQEAYDAVVRMMHREVANTHRAIQQTKDELQKGKVGELPPLQTRPPGQVNQPPSAAVLHLRQHPELKNAFDAKYGAGAADRELSQ